MNSRAMSVRFSYRHTHKHTHRHVQTTQIEWQKLRDKEIKVKGKGKGRINGTPSHSYGVSLAIWDHTVLPATQHK